MKKEISDSVEKMEGKPRKGQSTSRTKKGRQQSESVQLPFLLEFLYTLSTLILVLLALAIMITSFLAGASIFAIVLRTIVATTIVGFLLMMISSQVSSGLLFSVKVDREEEQRKQAESLLSPSHEEHGAVEA